MDKMIIITCSLFTMSQNVCYIENKEVKIKEKTTLDNLNNTVFNLLKEKDCHIVNIKGNKKFTQKIMTDLTKEKLSNYQDIDVQINLI